MRCPFCGTQDTRVVDSRLSGEGDKVRRRRECSLCRERFTTYEGAELVLPQVIKRNGNREPFDERKFRSGLMYALAKCPQALEHVEKIIAHVIHALTARSEREVSAQNIGELAMAGLRDLDQVAYMRFASVYRQFTNIKAFQKEIERLDQESASLDNHQQLSLNLLPGVEGDS